MQAWYVLVPTTSPIEPPPPRASALGLVAIIGDPTGQVAIFPSVAVTSSATAPVIIPDDDGQATLAEVQAAQAAATTAEDVRIVNGFTTVMEAIVAHLTLTGHA